MDIKSNLLEISVGFRWWTFSYLNHSNKVIINKLQKDWPQLHPSRVGLLRLFLVCLA